MVMTPRERMVCAVGHKIPDRVPVCPDISNMIPCRLTGKPFQQIYVENDPPLSQAYLDAVKYYGIDGWFWYASPHFINPDISVTSKWLDKSDERWVQESIVHTPKGDLQGVTIYQSDNPPSPVVKLIKNPLEDLPKLYETWKFSEVDFSGFEAQQEAIGEAGIIGTMLNSPGFHMWETMFEGGVQAVSFLMMDEPELLEELYQHHYQRVMAELPYHLACKPDMILTGGSGSVTMSSPTLWRQYGLPAIKEITRQAKEADILTMIHSCGKARYMVEACATETDLDCFNPLEIPPMGDCVLAELKEKFGDKLCLMGNLHTTEVMLRGTVAEVKDAARQAIEDGAKGGNFILSTGDQCGRDTPDENIFALLEVAEEYGRYDSPSAE